MKRSSSDKLLAQVRAICLALPEAVEVEAWGHPTFRAGKKMFAACGADDPHGAVVGMLMSFERQDELLKDDRFFPTPYAAHRGWVSLKLETVTDWDEVKSLIREAYQQVALKRMLMAMEEESELALSEAVAQNQIIYDSAVQPAPQRGRRPLLKWGVCLSHMSKDLII